MGIKIVNDTSLKSVADAIRAKSGISEPLEYPDGFVSAIEDIPTGGGGSAAVPEKEVNFYDYDGTCVYSYTPSEFAALTEMPTNPSHEGLTAQGWNWSLSDAKTYVADCGRLNVGQMYITDDGKTRIHIHLEQGRTSPILGVCPNGTVDVDWGDGTAHDTLTGTSITTVKWTPTHNYAAPGDYVIKLTVDGYFSLYGDSSTNSFAGLLRHSGAADGRNTVYRLSIVSINLGDNITYIGDCAFRALTQMKYLTIPNSVTIFGGYCFYQTSSLMFITIPSSLNSFGDDLFQAGGANKYSLNNRISELKTYMFSGQTKLRSILIPATVVTIGTYAFYSCASLSNVTIPKNVSKIDKAAFQNCYGLSEIHFKRQQPPTIMSSDAFTGLSADCKIYVPTGSLSAYTSASNYPSSTIYTYIEE